MRVLHARHTGSIPLAPTKKMITCCKCKFIAVWHYMPSTDKEDLYDTFYCEHHVNRGCSCNINPDTNEEIKDSLGRLLPCCEYDYKEDGYEDDYFDDCTEFDLGDLDE